MEKLSRRGDEKKFHTFFSLSAATKNWHIFSILHILSLMSDFFLFLRPLSTVHRNAVQMLRKLAAHCLLCVLSKDGGLLAFGISSLAALSFYYSFISISHSPPISISVAGRRRRAHTKKAITTAHKGSG
jgi:hypothetical protein